MGLLPPLRNEGRRCYMGRENEQQREGPSERTVAPTDVGCGRCHVVAKVWHGDGNEMRNETKNEASLRSAKICKPAAPA